MLRPGSQGRRGSIGEAGRRQAASAGSQAARALVGKRRQPPKGALSYAGHREDQFGVHFNLDATFKRSGERSQMEEVGIYTVANGKLVQEEFLYPV